MPSPHPMLSVSAIKNGTVIDHITAGKALTIIRLLKLANDERQVTVGLNLPSRLMGKKDLLKVHGYELSEDEANRVAIFAPQASVNIIKNYRVVKKFRVRLPESIRRVVTCPNPSCVTNHERMQTNFAVRPYKKAMSLQCAYCEKIFGLEEIQSYNV